MKRIVFLIFILITLSFTTGALIKRTSVVIAPESALYVNGDTNINTKVKCNYNLSSLTKEIPVYYKVVEGRMVFDEATLVLDNGCFDCGGNAINKDFQKLLKSKEYPQIFLSLKEIKDTGNNAVVEAYVNLSIAGVSNDYRIPIKTKREKELSIKGKLDISLSDFNMKPPKKFFGIVSLENNIEINFKLVIREY